jgi:hypothetical protein
VGFQHGYGASRADADSFRRQTCADSWADHPEFSGHPSYVVWVLFFLAYVVRFYFDRHLNCRLQAQVQQLWGFNLGYEHHEQKPIAFGAVNGNAARQMQLFSPTVVDGDSEAEENMDPAYGRGSDLHVMTEDGVWTKPEFKKLDDDYALHTLVGAAGQAR